MVYIKKVEVMMMMMSLGVEVDEGWFDCYYYEEELGLVLREVVVVGFLGLVCFFSIGCLVEGWLLWVLCFMVGLGLLFFDGDEGFDVVGLLLFGWL